MIQVRQKHKHCTVACIASILNEPDISFQESLVEKYPLELQKGKEHEGCPRSTNDLEFILKDVGVSQNPTHIASLVPSYQPIVDAIRAHKQWEEKCFLLTKSPTNHCMVVKEIKDDEIVLMNPEEDDPLHISFAELLNREPTVMVL